ncbi:hypothetical protein ACFVHW_31795 [Streptomyces sp. NPDC127110]|uniref:hypothetical protein n=1 Tax=Streptomyces sp. NPDC127110 TaxID=3345362 RepID=UPI00362AA6B2
MIFLYALGIWLLVSIPVALLCGRLIRHGESQARQARSGRHSRPHSPSWAHNDRNGDPT